MHRHEIDPTRATHFLDGTAARGSQFGDGSIVRRGGIRSSLGRFLRSAITKIHTELPYVSIRWCNLLVKIPFNYSKKDELTRFLESKLEGCKIKIEESETDQPHAEEATVSEGSQLSGLQKAKHLFAFEFETGRRSAEHGRDRRRYAGPGPPCAVRSSQQAPGSPFSLDLSRKFKLSLPLPEVPLDGKSQFGKLWKNGVKKP
jgi:hypothetical protein